MINMSPLEDRWLSVDEVAAMLSVSPATVRRLIAHDELRYIRVGKIFRISELGLAHWVAKGGTDRDWSIAS